MLSPLSLSHVPPKSRPSQSFHGKTPYRLLSFIFPGGGAQHTAVTNYAQA